MINHTCRRDSRKHGRSEGERRKVNALMTLNERREIHMTRARQGFLFPILTNNEPGPTDAPAGLGMEAK